MKSIASYMHPNGIKIQTNPPMSTPLLVLRNVKFHFKYMNGIEKKHDTSPTWG